MAGIEQDGVDPFDQDLAQLEMRYLSPGVSAGFVKPPPPAGPPPFAVQPPPAGSPPGVQMQPVSPPSAPAMVKDEAFSPIVEIDRTIPIVQYPADLLRNIQNYKLPAGYTIDNVLAAFSEVVDEQEESERLYLLEYAADAGNYSFLKLLKMDGLTDDEKKALSTIYDRQEKYNNFKYKCFNSKNPVVNQQLIQLRNLFCQRLESTVEQADDVAISNEGPYYWFEKSYNINLIVQLEPSDFPNLEVSWFFDIIKFEFLYNSQQYFGKLFWSHVRDLPNSEKVLTSIITSAKEQRAGACPLDVGFDKYFDDMEWSLGFDKTFQKALASGGDSSSCCADLGSAALCFLKWTLCCPCAMFCSGDGEEEERKNEC